MANKVVKRNGSLVDFDSDKIVIAILSALRSSKEGNLETAQMLSERVINEIGDNEKIKVEKIQDIIEEVLMQEGFLQTAKKYIVYREEHKQQRKFESNLLKRIERLDKETIRDNANIGHGTASKMYQIASESSKYYYLNKLIPKHLARLHKEGLIHLHDLDYFSKCPNCVPDFEYTAIKDMKGDIKNIQFSYLDNLFNEYPIKTNGTTEIIEPMGYKIYGRYGLTNINKIMRRKIKIDEPLYCIKTRKGLPLHLTGNHQVPVIRNNKEYLVFAKDIIKGDKLLQENMEFDEQYELPTNKNSLDVVDVLLKYDYNGYVYDLETEEHWFTVNNYIVHNCLSIPLDKLLMTGFNGEYGYINPPKRIKSALDLATHLIQRCSCDIFGGTMLPDLDSTIENLINSKQIEVPTDDELSQACQSLLFNLATQPTRSGNQVPFSSVTFGLETGKWGRKFALTILREFDKGMGHGETFIFPNLVFKIKEGINFNPGDPNYDIFRYAVKVSCNRMNPTWSFMDNAGNEGYDPKEVNIMGCRSRIVANRNGESVSRGRGNIFPTTINLPKIALKAKGTNYNKDMKDFWKKFNKTLDKVAEVSMFRYNILKNLKSGDIPFVFGESVYYGSDRLSSNDIIEESLKHGTIAIGFVGLAECLKELIGVHHGESEKGLKLGLEINKHIRDYCDKKSEETGLNWSCYATPAESTINKVIKDREDYGLIPGVTEKDYYSNSFHVPVYFPISIAKKIAIEGQFHRFNNGGHITYVELTDAPIYNPEGVEQILRYAKNFDIGYFGVNFPKDECLNGDCRYSGVIKDVCPKCGGTNIRRLARISGYLGIENRINESKKAEIYDRLKHDEQVVQ